METNKTVKQLEWIKGRIFESDLRISARGVPHLLVYRNSEVYSVAYFGRNRIFRVFYPYRSYNQTKITLRLREDVVNYFMPKENK